MSDIIESKDKTELIINTTDQSRGLQILGNKAELESRIEKYEEAREVILGYIDRNFVQGIDFGPTDDRSPKPTLKKPGAEKICRLFNTSPEWEIDRDTWEMLGKPEGVICYKCQIKDNATGRIIGEGRGAEKVGNKQRDANKSIKNAEKCALVDACLYTFMLSEKFTQDDGGRAALAELKIQLMGDISELRAGQESDTTDLVWLKEVLKQELHKTQIITVKEHAHIRKVIFEDKAFDLKTGKKL